MSQENEGKKAFVATEDLAAYRRIKLTSASGVAVEYADAGEAFIGITAQAALAGEYVTVLFRGAFRSYQLTAKEAFAVGASLYGGNDGKVQDTVSGNAIGTALEAATAEDDIVECLLDNGAASSLNGGNVLVTAEGGNGAIPVLLRKSGITDATGAGVKISDSIPFACKVIDWWLISRDTTAANVKLNNGTNDITANVAKGTVDDVIVDGGTIVAEYDELAAAGDLIVIASAAAPFDIFVLVEKI